LLNRLGDRRPSPKAGGNGAQMCSANPSSMKGQRQRDQVWQSWFVPSCGSDTIYDPESTSVTSTPKFLFGARSELDEYRHTATSELPHWFGSDRDW
jgi:hypothetical protein